MISHWPMSIVWKVCALYLGKHSYMKGWHFAFFRHGVPNAFSLVFRMFWNLGSSWREARFSPNSWELDVFDTAISSQQKGQLGMPLQRRRSWGWQRHGKDSFHSSRKSAPGAHSTWTSAAHAQEPQKWSTTWLHTMSNLCKSIRNPLINLKSRTHAYNFQIRQRDTPAGLRCGLGRWLTFPKAAMRSQISDDVL